MKITFFGQNTLLLEINSIKVLIDPFISGNPLAKDKITIDEFKVDYLHMRIKTTP